MSEPTEKYKFTPPKPSKMVTMSQGMLEQALADDRENEREQCMRDVCLDCSRGMPAELHPEIGSGYSHLGPGHQSYCWATPIRIRAEKKQ